jgi:hypothetical protein
MNVTYLTKISIRLWSRGKSGYSSFFLTYLAGHYAENFYSQHLFKAVMESSYKDSFNKRNTRRCLIRGADHNITMRSASMDE